MTSPSFETSSASEINSGSSRIPNSSATGKIRNERILVLRLILMSHPETSTVAWISSPALTSTMLGRV
jgi:hypothetical protein